MMSDGRRSALKPDASSIDVFLNLRHDIPIALDVLDGQPPILVIGDSPILVGIECSGPQVTPLDVRAADRLALLVADFADELARYQGAPDRATRWSRLRDERDPAA